MASNLEITPELLVRRGIPLMQVATEAGAIASDLDAGISGLGVLAGTGEVANAYHAQIKPVLEWGRTLLGGLSASLDNNFDGVHVTGQSFSDAEEHNTSMVNHIRP
jgi:hypothetical protein